MKNTLQAISNHKYVNILENIGKADITHNINFSFIKKLINNIEDLNTVIDNIKKISY